MTRDCGVYVVHKSNRESGAARVNAAENTREWKKRYHRTRAL